MKLTKQLAIAMVSAGVFGGVLTGVQGTSASAKATAKVLQVKTIKTANYKAVKGAKGYLYSTAKLTKKVHNVKNYSNTKFSVSKEAVVRKSNGNKAIYYYVKSAKASGWLWHGYLNKVTPKAASDAKISALEQQIAELAQRLSALQSQPAASTPAAPVTSSADVAKLQAQIDSLQGQLSAVKGSAGAGNGSGSTSGTSVGSNSSDSVDAAAVANAFDGTPTKYYTEGQSYIYAARTGNELAGSGIAGSSTGLDTAEVYPFDNKDEGRFPVDYKGTKGWIPYDALIRVKVDTPDYMLGDGIHSAGMGNIAPTSSLVKFTKPLGDGAYWYQYTDKGLVHWQYNASTKTWRAVDWL
jgi:uncharacterized coiled-coil protein SlyX